MENQKQQAIVWAVLLTVFHIAVIKYFMFYDHSDGFSGFVLLPYLIISSPIVFFVGYRLGGMQNFVITKEKMVLVSDKARYFSILFFALILWFVTYLFDRNLLR